MTAAHRIRLRGGWAVSPLPDGGFRHARRFGAPRALDPAETVWLTGENASGTVTVNGAGLGRVDGSFAVEISRLLQPRNQVWIDVVGDGELGEVAVEFRACSAC